MAEDGGGGAKGIDVFRVYQNVYDWAAVKRSGVDYCWIKATDGLGVATFNADKNWAPAPADPTVHGARSVGIAEGLYHWGTGKDPKAEAAVFAGEVIRLGCLGEGKLPPALDAEDDRIGATWDIRRAWCIAFLRELQRLLDQERVCIYMSASWAQALRPDLWDIPGLVIWIAAYGTNNGSRSRSAVTQFYKGPYDVQQYTSLGVHLVDGIESQGLDVNEADTPLDELLGGSDVGLSQGDLEDIVKEVKYILAPSHDDEGAFFFVGPDGAKRSIVDMLIQSNANELALAGLVQLLLEKSGFTAAQVAAELAPVVVAGVVAALPKDETGNIAVDVDEANIAAEVVGQIGRKFTAA